MRSYRFIVFIFLLACSGLFAQKNFTKKGVSWTVYKPFTHNAFIENKGQFTEEEKKQVGDKIMYYSINGSIHIYFSTNSITFRYDSVVRTENEGAKEEIEKEDNGRNLKVVPVYLKLNWLGANEDAQLEVNEPTSDYYTYSDPADASGHSGILANAWKTLTYHNIYKGIDVEFYYPEKGGIEYNIFVHPGADPSLVKMQYVGNALVSLVNQNVQIASPCANITDHNPTGKDENGNKVDVRFKVNNNTVSFATGGYDKSRMLTIDPWDSSTHFAGWNSAFDVDYDNTGNVYIYGGQAPYQLLKFNSNGVLQWTYTEPFGGTDVWYGGFVVDHRTGDSYVVSGLGGTSPTSIVKVNSAGIQIAGLSAGTVEFWRADFDYCNNQVVIAGGLLVGACTVDPALTTFTNSNVTGNKTTCCEDFTLQALDQAGNAYMATALSSFSSPTYNNTMMKLPLPSLSVPSYQVPDNYHFQELLKLTFYPDVPNSGHDYAMGFNGMAANKEMLITYDGATAKKWAPATGALLDSVKVTGTSFLCSGVDIDCADNIYIGNVNHVNVYDYTLTLIGSMPAYNDTIYDLKLGNNQLYACGKGFVSSRTYTADTVEVAASFTLPTSCTACDGKAIAYLKGCGLDSTKYSYQWSNGQTASQATGLCYGKYAVTITVNCEKQYSDSIVLPGSGTGGMSLSLVQTNITCANTNNGTASVTVAGGTSPYSYNWQPSGNTNSSVSGLTAGTYTLIVTDAGGDCIPEVFVIAPSPVIGVIITSFKDESCIGTHDGSATAAASGGTPGYIYKWSPSGGTGSTASNLSSGTYTITVTDKNGCSGTDTLTLNHTSSFNIKVAATNVSCIGLLGTAKVYVFNSSGLYFITWSSSVSTLDSIGGLSPGKYYVTVRDSNTGCIITDTFNIIQPVGPLLTTTQTNLNCNGLTNGSATVTVTGGKGTYTFSWNNGGTNATINNLSAGTYNVIVSDSAGCTTIANVTITEPPQILANTSFTDESCAGKNDGSASASPSSGLPPFTYLWSPTGSTNSSISGLSAGTYTLIVSDSAGCSVKDSVTITALTPGFIVTGADSICIGNNTLLSVAGGVSYIWSTGATSSSITVNPSSVTTYSVVVTNSAGCKDSLKKTVTVSPYPVINACCDSVIYPGQSVQLLASGGGTYFWTPNIGLSCDTCADPLATPTVTTSYSVTVTSSSGCVFTDSVLVKTEGCGTVFVPNAFSPNNDGQNDILYVRGPCIKYIDFAIYDRWGNKIFESGNVTDGWDGTYKGQPMNTGTYVYYLKTLMLDNTEQEKKGNVTLVR